MFIPLIDEIKTSGSLLERRKNSAEHFVNHILTWIRMIPGRRELFPLINDHFVRMSDIPLPPRRRGVLHSALLLIFQYFSIFQFSDVDIVAVSRAPKLCSKFTVNLIQQSTSSSKRNAQFK